MAGKKFGKDSTEFQMFADFWQLCQSYWEPEEGDEWWEKVTNAVEAFEKKYGMTRFVRGLGIALISSLDEEAKRANEDVNRKKE